MTEASHATHATIRQDEIAKEQRYVDRVYARLETLRREAQQARRESYSLAAARVPGSLVERDAMAYHTAQRLRALDAEYEGLVFGRLDLREPAPAEGPARPGNGVSALRDGASGSTADTATPAVGERERRADGEVRYIGRLGLRDADYEPLVIDWRAPGAAPFYQATAEHPMGVLRRRVIRCSGPTVLDIEDDLLDPEAAAGAPAVTVVGDGALIASLARARGTRMRDIVATIQREQDEAIRAPAGGVTLIEGGPGTGKTAVALHRAAHLLYRDRRRYEGGGVLLIGPSPVFMAYVERVLPSLGEETVELRALGEVLDGFSTDRLDPPALAAIKGGLRMRRLLQRALREAPQTAPDELRIVYGGEVLRLREPELRRVRRELHSRGRRPNLAGRDVRRALIQALWHRRPEDVAWSESRFADEVADRDEFLRFVQAWWPMRAPVDVLADLTDPARVRRAAGNTFTAEECAALAGSWSGVERGEITVADVALLDELRSMLGDLPEPQPEPDEYLILDGISELTTVAERHFAARERPPRPDNYDEYAHVLVDEAQDVTPMQWRMLGRRGQYASWTIVGDAAQSAWPDLAEARRARGEALRGKQLRRFHLGVNYRNSAEIFTFAAPVVRRAVPDADLPRAVRHTGVTPQHRTVAVSELPAAVRSAAVELLDAVEGTVGVIAASGRHGDAAEWLVGLGRSDRPGESNRLQVVDGMHAKGMEYDAVVVVAPEELAAESAAGVRVLYVALTRATHRLVTVGVDDSWLVT